MKTIQSKVTRLSCVFISLFCAMSALNSQADALNYNVVSLSASAQEDLPNDLMQVTLISRHQDNRADHAANKVNKDMAWAVKQLKGNDGIDYQTGNYSTHPTYSKNNRINAWTASQILTIKSEDFSQVAKLIAKLQEQLQVQEMSFLTKDSSREAVQEKLISKALAAFKRKAVIIKDAMGAEKYEVIDINIDQQRNSPMLGAYRGGMEMMSRDAVAAPVLEAGKSTVSIHVRGTVQLQH